SRARDDREDRPRPQMHARALRLRRDQHLAAATRPLRTRRRTNKNERSTMKDTQKFTAEERAAMKARAKELKDAERTTKDKAAGEKDVLAAIAGMPPKDRALAKQVHALVKSSAPDLSPKTWYGMPAYAKDGK